MFFWSFLRIDFYFLKEMFLFFKIYNDGRSKVGRKKKKDIRHLFRLKKELNDIAVKDIRNLFRLKK